MNQGSQQQLKTGFFIQRPNSPKNILSSGHSFKNIALTMSIGANQSSNTFVPMIRSKQQLPNNNSQTSLGNISQKQDKLQVQIRYIAKENAYLKEQNEMLRKQLFKIKKQPINESIRSSEKYISLSPQSHIDLRGTIKKQIGQMKQMRVKIEMLSKQCKNFEQIIQKMSENIKKLTHQNYKKSNTIDHLQNQVNKIQQIKQKINQLFKVYNDLQNKYNNDQKEWIIWKKNWIQQKRHYLEKIRELQKINTKFS